MFKSGLSKLSNGSEGWVEVTGCGVCCRVVILSLLNLAGSYLWGGGQMYELETTLGPQVAFQVSSLSMKPLQVLAYLERVILRTELFSMSSWQCGACVVRDNGFVTFGADRDVMKL